MFVLNTYDGKLLRMIMGLLNTLRKYCIMKSVREKAKAEELEKDKKD